MAFPFPLCYILLKEEDVLYLSIFFFFFFLAKMMMMMIMTCFQWNMQEKQMCVCVCLPPFLSIASGIYIK